MRPSFMGATITMMALGACTIAPIAVGTPPALMEPSDMERSTLVESQNAYFEAAESAQPGDRIVLKNGIWLDFDMLLDAEGTAEAPMMVTAETPGEVIFSGQSSLRLAGQHLVVSGLVFRNGYTPRAEVISFRRDGDKLAFNSRVTETVIEDYSNPDRAQRDIWVVMHGQNNVFDRNHLSGKLNSGPTMAVRLNTEDSQHNGHIISNNYFGPRPVFGSNGGETLRIGTSHFSLTHSGTQIENNYFDRCGGEVEIISNKSGGNVFRGNTFFESRGTLTLRHGNGTLVEGNLFDGNGAPHTGGVRIINARQTVRNNYFTGLTGERFSSALVVMNGVPDSPINRYHQVDGAVIEGNVFDSVRRISLGEGSDTERSAVPINSTFSGNTVIGDRSETPFRLLDDIRGIAFADNVSDVTPPTAIASGFDFATRAEALSGLEDASSYGVSRNDAGVEWYPKAPDTSPFEGGRRIQVAAGADALGSAIAKAEAGDTLILAPGRYAESKLVNLRIPLTIEAADAGNSPVITFERPNLFLLSGGGDLRMYGITVSGEASPDSSGNSFISTTAMGESSNHTVELTDMAFVDFDVNRGFSVVAAAKGTFYDRISVLRSRFSDVSGVVVKLDAETDDYGIYNAEYLTIENSSFNRIGGPVVAVYRGGRDESTFGPHVWVRDSEFDGVGLRGGPLMLLHGVQNLELTGNRVTGAAPAEFTITTGQPHTDISGNVVVGEGARSVLTTVDLR